MALVVLLRGVNVGGLGEQGADRRGVLASQKNYMSLYLCTQYANTKGEDAALGCLIAKSSPGFPGR